MKNEIIIIGGGIAGLSAAVRAIQKGFRPIILEKNRYLGGRVRSFFAQDLQRTIDNGQHVLSAAYLETIDFLKTIGSHPKILFQPVFQSLFVRDPQQQYYFQTYRLPAPYHFFLPLIMNKKFTGIRFNKYLPIIKDYLKMNDRKLKPLTVTEWLCGSSPDKRFEELLWNPLSYAVLNTPANEASAVLLKSAISRSFLRSPEKARLGLPADWLEEIFAAPAEKFIKENGGSIYLLNPVSRLIAERDEILTAISKKQSFDTPNMIITVPPYALASLIKESGLGRMTEFLPALEKIQYNAIITINLFLNEPIDSRFPIAPLCSPLQWIFPHPAKKSTENIHGYAIVMSGANDWAWKSPQEILEMVKNELFRLLGIELQRENLLVQFKIIKEKRATIAQTPEVLDLRLPVKTPYRNMVLAGDWTDTGLPATIEGAVLSGKNAVDFLLANRMND